MEQIPHHGCLPCLIVNFRHRLATVQHVVEGGKRLGHSWTYGACPWHHQGIADPWDDYQAERMLGPSLAWNQKAYQERFGTERELVELQDVILSLPPERTYLAIRWYADKPQYDKAIPQMGKSR